MKTQKLVAYNVTLSVKRNHALPKPMSGGLDPGGKHFYCFKVQELHTQIFLLAWKFEVKSLFCNSILKYKKDTVMTKLKQKVERNVFKFFKMINEVLKIIALHFFSCQEFGEGLNFFFFLSCSPFPHLPVCLFPVFLFFSPLLWPFF